MSEAKNDGQSPAEIFERAWKRGVQSGTSGAAAMSIEVIGLMWLRTTVNYQVRIILHKLIFSRFLFF